MTRVFLLGSQTLSLAGLRALLKNNVSLEVIGQREHPKDALSPPPRTRPDLVLIDHEEHEPLEPLTVLAKNCSADSHILVLTTFPDSELMASAFRQGARGMVSKNQPPEVLIEAIHRVSGGEVWLERAAATRLIGRLLHPDTGQFQHASTPTLSVRDHRIIQLVAEGLRNCQIADELCVSEATIRNQLTTIFRRVGVSGRLQLVVYACHRGLVTPPRGDDGPTAMNLRLV